MSGFSSISLSELARSFGIPEEELDLIAVANKIPVQRHELGLPRIKVRHYLRLKAAVEGKEICEKCGGLERVEEWYPHGKLIVPCTCAEAKSV